MQEQVRLELEMRSLGDASLRGAIEKARDDKTESSTPYGTSMVAASVARMAALIERDLAAANTGKPGRRMSALKYLGQLDANVAAFIALKRIIDGVTTRRTLQTVALSVAAAIEDEVRFAGFEKDHKPLFRKVEKQLKKAATYSHKKRVMSVVQGRTGQSWVSWPNNAKLHLGQKCISLAMEATGWFELANDYNKRHHASAKGKKGKGYHPGYMLVCTEAAKAWVTNRQERTALRTPQYLPTVVPPKDWTHPFGGGYHTEAIQSYPLVKVWNEAYLEELENKVEEMPAVYEAINAVQSTPWCVNKPVLAVATELWDGGLTVAGLARSTRASPRTGTASQRGRGRPRTCTRRTCASVPSGWACSRPCGLRA
jgi:DNA-directed RNA polymerase